MGVGSLASKLDATNVNIGFRTGTATTTSTMTSKVNLSGGTVTFGGTGGLLDPVGTGVDIGNSTYNQAGVARTVGELNISGGNVTIHNGTGGFAVRIGTNTSAAGGIVTASMNLTGGTTTLAGDIVKGTATGTVNSTLKLTGGTLDLGGNDIGATGAGAITLTAESGTLKNVGSINGTGGLTKTTAGTLIIEGTNGYTGPTAVSAGVLAVNGSLANTTTTVDARLQGSGTIGGSVTIQSGGTLAPGNSIESLGVASVNFLAGSTYEYELNSAALNGDLTYSTGTLDITNGVGPLGTTLTLTELFAGTLAVNSKLTLISYTGGWTSGELFNYLGSTLADDSTFTLGANQWLFNYNDTTGGSNYSSDQAGAGSFVTITVIPEPNVAALLGGLGTLALLRRRRELKNLRS